MKPNKKQYAMLTMVDEVAKMRREDESKWVQRAKIKHIQKRGATLNIST
jgi:hypothetical protein